MPRIIKGLETTPRPVSPELVGLLADELKSKREFGQPRIEEEVFPRTNLIKVNVIWDRWDDIPDMDRMEIILQAYEKVEGKEYRERITLAGGYTFPEAYEFGHLPYRIIPAVRASDSVTPAQCHAAMLALGASMLFDAKTPHLLLTTRAEAEACKNRLIKNLPGSADVWLWEKDLSPKENWNDN